MTPARIGRALHVAWVEAVANVLATPMRFLIVAAVVAGAVGFLAAREASLVHTLGTLNVDRARAGDYIVDYTAGRSSSTSAAIPGERCDALGAMPGIVAAGVLHETPNVVAGHEPDGGFASATASPGFLRILRYAGAPPDVLVGSAAAGELGLTSGSLVRLDGTTRDVGVIPAVEPRTSAVDRSFVTVVPASTVSGECCVEFSSPAPEPNFLPVLFGLSGDANLVSTPLINTAILGLTAQQRYVYRPDRWWWPGIAAIALLPWLLLLRMRRSELALYTITGARRTWVALMVWLEWVTLLVPGLLFATAVTAVTSHRDGDAAAAAIAVIARTDAALLLAAAVVAIGVTLLGRSEFEALRSAD